MKLESIKREKTRKERGKDLIVMAIGVFPFVFFLVRFPLSSAEGGGALRSFPPFARTMARVKQLLTPAVSWKRESTERRSERLFSFASPLLTNSFFVIASLSATEREKRRRRRKKLFSLSLSLLESFSPSSLPPLPPPLSPWPKPTATPLPTRGTTSPSRRR